MAFSSMKQRVDKIRADVLVTTRPFTRAFVVYMIALLASYLIVQLFRIANVQLSTTIWLSDGVDSFGVAAFPLFTLAEIFFFGPWMSVIMTLCFRKSMVFWKKCGLMPAKKSQILTYLFIVSILLMNTGLVTNRAFNIVSAMVKDFYDATTLGFDNYVFAYFLDELVGHHLMNAGMILFFLVMALAMPRDSSVLGQPAFLMNGGEKVLVLVPSVIYGVIFSYENLEGQSAVFSIVMLGILAGAMIVGIMMKKKGYAIGNRPFFTFIIIQLIVMAVFLLVWGITLGTKPYYPFFYEPSELQNTRCFHLFLTKNQFRA
nr:hypothetical protein [Candidatus Sigynarchaeota archaeon]